MGYSSTFRFYKYSINLSMNFKQKFTVPFNFFYQTNIPRSDFSLRIFTKSWERYVYLIKDSFCKNIKPFFNSWKNINFYLTNSWDFFQNLTENYFFILRDKYNYHLNHEVVNAISTFNSRFYYFDYRGRSQFFWISNILNITKSSFFINAFETSIFLYPRLYFKYRNILVKLIKYHKSWYFLFNTLTSLNLNILLKIIFIRYFSLYKTTLISKISINYEDKFLFLLKLCLLKFLYKKNFWSVILKKKMNLFLKKRNKKNKIYFLLKILNCVFFPRLIKRNILKINIFKTKKILKYVNKYLFPHGFLSLIYGKRRLWRYTPSLGLFEGLKYSSRFRKRLFYRLNPYKTFNYKKIAHYQTAMGFLYKRRNKWGLFKGLRYKSKFLNYLQTNNKIYLRKNRFPHYIRDQIKLKLEKRKFLLKAFQNFPNARGWLIKNFLLRKFKFSYRNIKPLLKFNLKKKVQKIKKRIKIKITSLFRHKNTGILKRKYKKKKFKKNKQKEVIPLITNYNNYQIKLKDFIQRVNVQKNEQMNHIIRENHWYKN